MKRNVLCLGVLSSFLCIPLSCHAANTLASALSEGKFHGSISIEQRAVDFDSEPKSGDQNSVGLFTHLTYETAPISGISAGIGFLSGNDVTWDDDYLAYNYMLANSRENNTRDNYSELSEYFVRYFGHNTKVTIGAQSDFYTPYMNSMFYKVNSTTYRGVTFSNTSFTDFRINLGYITDILVWPYVNGFVPIIENPEFQTKHKTAIHDFSATLDSSGAAAYAGIIYSPGRKLNANIWYQLFEDCYSIITPQFRWSKNLNKDLSTTLNFLYTRWDNDGEQLIGDVETDMFGFNGNLEYKGFLFELSLQKTGDNDVTETFGNRRAVGTLTYNAGRAEEMAYAFKLGYNFREIGIEGLYAYAQYAIYDTPDYGETNFSQDTTELEFNVEYKIRDSKNAFLHFLKGTSIRLRYSISDADEEGWETVTLGARDPKAQEVRIKLAYKF